MLTVGASEAETHLAELLERVAEGEEVLITRHGKAIARLAPPTVADRERVDEVISKLKAVRAGLTLGDLNWKDLRDEGRR
ncbi:MAG: type II toxin-antitoxin system prevent-host-death family antitoxin [Rhodospirillales bacterium]|nr:type II toxin-antitoxin system prevent-host-death family antitoxin [Rhodospirillales bacterium]